MENPMQGPSLTPFDIQSEMILAQRLADRCGMVLGRDNEISRSMQMIKGQQQQIEALGKQVEDLTKANAAQAAQIAAMNEELVKLRLTTAAPAAPKSQKAAKTGE